MNVNKQAATLLLASGLVIGGLGAGFLMTPSPSISQAAPLSQDQPAAPDADQSAEPSYTGSIPVDATATDGLSEADESTALQDQATISTADAEASALAANPGAKVVKSELDNENGYLVFSVELDNGLDVKVDAGNGTILASDQDSDEGNSEGDAEEANESEEDDANDTDDIQDEQEDNDATEAPDAEEDNG
jgi:uncharacterized membrane protein YkoI